MKINRGQEVTIYVNHYAGTIRGTVDDFDDSGIKVLMNKKHIFVPNSSIIYIEWREKTVQKKVDEWTKK